MGIPLLDSLVGGDLRGLNLHFSFMATHSPQQSNTSTSSSPKDGASAKKLRTEEPLNITSEYVPSFFVLHSMTEKTLGDMNPFFIDKSIQGLVGTVKKISKMRSGDLLVETPNRTLSINLMRVTAFGDIPISVTPHRSLNSSKGVVISRDLLSVTEEELQEGLESQGVTNVKRIMLRKGGLQTPSRVLILTFNRPKLPESVKVGYLHCTVRPYIPNPLRCFLCQRYGHSKNVCRGSPICARCAKSDHDFEACELDPVCANCQGAHPAYSRACPKWQHEKAVQQYRVEKNVPYLEARRAVAPFTDRPLYSTAVKKVMVSAVVQTELTVPPSQPIPPTVQQPRASSSSQLPCQHCQSPRSSQSRPTSRSRTQTQRASSTEAQLRRIPTQQTPQVKTKDAQERTSGPASAQKPAQAAAAKPKPVRAPAASVAPPRQQSPSVSRPTSPIQKEFVPQQNSFSVLSSHPDSGEMDVDHDSVFVDARMDVDGRGHSPRKKSSKSRERTKVLPPPP